MRKSAARLALLLMTVMTACASSQGQDASQASPVKASPEAMHGQQEMAAGKPAAGPLKIAFGDQINEWTTLAALPHVTLTAYNEHAKATQTYSGVPVFELIKKLGVPEKPRGKDFRLYLVAVGADGYKVVYSVAETNPDVHDGTVIVADAMDGKPIGANGPFQLVAAGEKRPARWVRNLVGITVLTAP